MTESLSRLERRTHTAEELLSVVKTMKSLAAASIRDYQRAAESLAAYNKSVEMGFKILLHRAPGALGRAAASTARTAHAIILLGSDQGMVGRFNEELVSYVQEQGEELSSSRGARTIAVGLRLAAVLDGEGVVPNATIELPASAEGIVGSVQAILPILDGWRESEEDLRVALVHHRPRERQSYGPARKMLLPIDLHWLEGLAGEPWPHRGIPGFSMSVEGLARALVRQFLLVSLQRALAESLAAENAKRLSAMQAAEKNVMERIDLLRGEYRKQRQALITSELLEVTSGFQVLSE